MGTINETGGNGTFQEFNVTYPYGPYEPQIAVNSNFQLTSVSPNDVHPAGDPQLNSIFMAADSGIYLIYNQTLHELFEEDTEIGGIPKALYFDGQNLFWVCKVPNFTQTSLMKVSATLNNNGNGNYNWTIGEIYLLTYLNGIPTGIDGNGNGLLWISTSQGVYQYSEATNQGFILLLGMPSPNGVRFHKGNLFVSDNVSNRFYQHLIGTDNLNKLNFTIVGPGRFWIGGSSVLEVGIATVILLISLTI